ncbi:MAG: hypothetical protein Q9205_004831 [Flavoplaca limonia]
MQLDQLLLSSLRSFGELLKLVNAPRYNYKDEVSAASWIDELGRLRIWAGNVGAHQTGSSSLEFRLRDSSHIRDEVKNLLTDLERLLAEAQKYISTEDHGSGTSSTNDSSDEEPTTELQALFGEVVTIIQCLYKLAMIIRNPAQHDFLAESYKADTAAFEPFDEQHVRNKFPQAKEELIHRLAKALTRRRGYLKYRARHSMKLEKGLEGIKIGGGGVAASISETTASVLQAQPVDYNETSSDSGIPVTSYASSIVEGGTITVPPPPKGSLAGNPFPCPYCHFIINPATTHAWHRHIFTDLRPYTCMYQPCRTPDKLYPSRHDWLGHIHDIHDIESLLCPLCQAVMETVKQYEQHVARHMEELALFVLPRCKYLLSHLHNKLPSARCLELRASIGVSQGLPCAACLNDCAIYILTPTTLTGNTYDEDKKGLDERGVSVSNSDERSPLRGTNEWLEDTKDEVDYIEESHEWSSLQDAIQNDYSPYLIEETWHCLWCGKRFSTKEDCNQHTHTHEYDHRSLTSYGEMAPINYDSTVTSKIRLYYPQEGTGSSNHEFEDFDASEEPPGRRHDGITIRFESLSGKPTVHLRFSASLIASGDLSVGEVKLKAHTALSNWLKQSGRSLSEADGIEFFFAGQMLENDARSCRDAALSSGAVILARVPPDAGASPQETKSQDLVMDPNHPDASKMKEITPTTPISAPPHMGEKEVIYFKDCLGRNWRFPFRTCSNWDTMNRVIRKIFLDVDVDDVRSNVAQGYFDIMGPSGYAIPPQDLEDVIQPGLHMTMHLWQPDDSRRRPEENGLKSSDQPEIVIPGESPNTRLDAPEGKYDTVNAAGRTIIPDFGLVRDFQTQLPAVTERAQQVPGTVDPAAPDIVDVDAPVDGNIWKLLPGSINDWFDSSQPE